MSIVRLELGALNLACPTDEVVLFAASTLTFMCSDPAIYSLTPQKLSQALRTAKAVVKRGPGCRIEVEVQCDGVVSDEGSAEISKESIGIAISRASWWSQLPISPVLQKLPEFVFAEQCPFRIAIADTLPDFHMEDVQDASSSSQDVKIPSGVPVLQILCIAVKFQFRRLPNSTNVAFKDMPSEAMDTSFEGILDDHDVLHDGQLLLKHGCNEHAKAGQPIWMADPCFSEVSEHEDPCLLEEDESMLSHSFSAELSTFESQESMQTNLTAPDDHRNDDFPQQATITEKAARLLTDVAMRTLIGGAQIVPTEGIQLLRPLPRHTLAVLMPLLFSPRFSSTMHQRSRFLPTVTRTITSLDLTAQSPGLRSKLSKLKSKSCYSSHPSLAGAVQSHAYRVMHTSLFSAKAARSLRVGEDEDGRKVDKEEDSMIIDGSAVSLERRSPTKLLMDDDFQMDFEDMLEDEPLSEEEIDMLLDLEIMRQGHLPSCSILLSDFGDEVHLPQAESMMASKMDDFDDVMREPKDDSMMEISEKSYVGEDIEHHSHVDSVAMLF